MNGTAGATLESSASRLKSIAESNGGKLPCNPIAFEGGDGCGKGTALDGFMGILRDAGIDAVRLREPGGTWIGERVRDILLDDRAEAILPYTEALLFAAARNQIVHEVIKPAIEAGRQVVLDRFEMSSLVYQEKVGGLPAGTVDTLNAPSIDGIDGEMLTVYLRLDADTAQARVAGRDREQDRLDKKGLGYHKSVCDGYDEVFDANDGKMGFGRCVSVDAGGTPDEVLAAVVGAICDACAEMIGDGR